MRIKTYSEADILLIEGKVKVVQLSCFSDLGHRSWMNIPVYDLMNQYEPVDVPKELQLEFERLVRYSLDSGIKRPKYLKFSEWIREGGSGIKTLWSIFYLDHIHNNERGPLILYHFERFHPLCYDRLMRWFMERAKSSEIVLLSTNAVYTLDYHDDTNPDLVKKFIELNDGKIVSINDFVCKVMKVPTRFLEKPYLYDIRKIYMNYCENTSEL